MALNILVDLFCHRQKKCVTERVNMVEWFYETNVRLREGSLLQVELCDALTGHQWLRVL